MASCPRFDGCSVRNGTASIRSQSCKGTKTWRVNKDKAYSPELWCTQHSWLAAPALPYRDSTALIHNIEGCSLLAPYPPPGEAWLSLAQGVSGVFKSLVIMTSFCCCTLVPAPIFSVEPIRMRTLPPLTGSNRIFFSASLSAS